MGGLAKVDDYRISSWNGRLLRFRTHEGIEIRLQRVPLLRFDVAGTGVVRLTECNTFLKEYEQQVLHLFRSMFARNLYHSIPSVYRWRVSDVSQCLTAILVS